jgi:hypothetical protein
MKQDDIAFVRVRLMTDHGREWVCCPVDAQGNDLPEPAAFVWADRRAIVTVAEARKIVRRQ